MPHLATGPHNGEGSVGATLRYPAIAGLSVHVDHLGTYYFGVNEGRESRLVTWASRTACQNASIDNGGGRRILVYSLAMDR